MGKNKEQYTKGVLTTIEKIINLSFILIILFNLHSCDMSTEFKVFGEKNLLKDLKINIKLLYYGGYDVKTLLYKGEIYNINETGIDSYTIYVSYQDSLICMLHIDNMDQWANDYINHIYIDKQDDMITLQYIGREIEIKNRLKYDFSPLVPIDEYFNNKSIFTYQDKQRELIDFFTLYAK